MLEELPAFLMGALTTLLGFGLTMLWDLLKANRDAAAKAKAVLVALGYELSSNLAAIRSNRTLLQQELEFLKEDKTCVAALAPFHSGAWLLVCSNLPKCLEHEIIGQLSEAMY